MEQRRRRVLQTIASLSVPTVAGCLDRLRGDDTESTEGNTTSAEGSSGTDIDALAGAGRRLVGSVFEDRAYDRATEQFSQQAKRLFRPVYFEQVRLGATAVAGDFGAVAGTADQSTSGLASVTLDLSFEQSDAQFVVSGAPDALTRAILDGEYRSPEYVDGSAVDEREVTLSASDCDLPGTLAVPAGDSTVSGAVIVHGDGIIDRDFETGGTAMYRDLATGLASNGIATLRYDKRTLACDLSPSSTTLDREVVDDALVAIDRLQTVDRVDQVVVIGHSLGALAQPRILARSEDAAGGVGLATPFRPLQQLAVSQTAYLIDTLERTEQLQARLPSIRSAAQRVTAGDYTDGERVLGRAGSFWDSLRSYDHVATAAEQSVPQLYLQGSRDFQVDPEADYQPLREQLSSETVSFDQYPGLNHRFMPTEGPSLATEYRMPNTVSASVVTALTEWIDTLG